MTEPWLALFQSSAPGDNLKDLLASQECAMPLFLDRADSISAGPKPFHYGSVLAHMARCMNETAGDPLAVWMAMAHDAGKLTTPVSMLPHHYGHESRGKKLASIWARQIGLPDEWVYAGAFAAKQHMRAAKYPIMRPGKKLGLLQLVAESRLALPFWKVIDADTHSRLSKIVLADAEKMAEWQKEGLSEQDQIQLLKMRSTI